ncbi:MAG TPA: hypothetical protein VM008_09980 [Phycisphaerae bacterium]|nr:hypothetical protein [Phycisphaerae bacterium]
MRTERSMLAAVVVCAVVMGGRAWGLGAGDLVVYETRNDIVIGSNNAAPVSILEISPTSGLVQSIAVSTQASPLYSTTMDPIANMALSANGAEVSFPGWAGKGVGALGLSPSVPRGVGTVSGTGVYGQPSTFTVASAGVDQPHAAYSPDGVNWYFGATSGMYYNGGTAPLTGSDATLSIKGFGGKTYALHTLDTPFLNGNDVGPGTAATVLSTVTPTTPGAGITSISYTPVVTLPTAAHDFVLLSSFNQAPDTLYVTTNNGISKYSGSGSSWTAEGTFALTGATSITGAFVTGIGVELFVTVDTGSGSTVVGKLEEVVDTAAHNVTMSAGTPTVLYTAPSFDALEGVAFAPVPEPAGVGMLVVGSLGLLGRRRGGRRD